ncbi:SDR family oxidoreductase [Candidatus Roizmanbacteria bacterium]|nr:SDR family oxidoreductase [Candidatus Roizmanbacteria bacterium]
MKIAVVTGASTGIGRSISIALASHGYFVYLLARRQEQLEQTKKLITDQGGQSESVVADLSSLDSVNEAIATIKNKAGSIEVLANIAGVWHGVDEVFAGKDFETFEQKVILDTYNVGTIVPTLLAHAFIPLMKSNGKIINLSGTFENGAKGWLPYYVSKRAIEDLTVALSQELEDRDIQVNCISPSDTATEAYAKFFPQYMDEAINPEKIANKVLELVDPEDKLTGKVIVMKKDKEPVEGFHS